jgi:hypothetical protein
MKNLCYSVISLGLILVLQACRGTLPPHERPAPPQTLLTTAEPIWQRLIARRAAYQSLKGLAELRLYTTNGKGSIDNTTVVLDDFDAMRLEGIGPFGQPLFLLVATTDRFSFFLPRERRVISGPSSTEQLGEHFGVPVAPKLLPYLLLGDLPLLTLPQAGALRYQAQEQLYFWEGASPHQAQMYRIWFDPYHLLPVRLELADLSGQTLLHVTYEDFRPATEFFTLPHQITIVQPLAEQRVIWHYTDVELNTRVSPGLFHMRIPPGIERVELP